MAVDSVGLGIGLPSDWMSPREEPSDVLGDTGDEAEGEEESSSSRGMPKGGAEGDCGRA